MYYHYHHSSLIILYIIVIYIILNYSNMSLEYKHVIAHIRIYNISAYNYVVTQVHSVTSGFYDTGHEKESMSCSTTTYVMYHGFSKSS